MWESDLEKVIHRILLKGKLVESLTNKGAHSMPTEENKAICRVESQQPGMIPLPSAQSAGSLQDLSDAELEAITGGVSDSGVLDSSRTSDLSDNGNGTGAIKAFHYPNPVIG